MRVFTTSKGVVAAAATHPDVSASATLVFALLGERAMHRSKSLIRCKLDGHVRHVFKKRRDVPGEKSARTSGGGDSATGGDDVGVHAGLHRANAHRGGHLDDRRTESTDATGDERDRRHGHVRPLLEQFLRRAVKRKVRTDGDAGAETFVWPLQPMIPPRPCAIC